MPLKITNTKDSEAKKGISALIYGDSGTGKTTLLGSLPGKTLILDVEGGTSVLREKSIDVVRIMDDLSNLKEVFNALQTEELGYQNICLDSATELEKFMQITLAGNDKNGGIPTLKDYGTSQFKMREYLRVMRDLKEKGINVVVTALEMQLELQQTDGEIRTRSYPMLSKKLAPEVCGLYDMVGHVEVSTKKETTGQRFIRLDPTEQIVAKDRIFKRQYCVCDGAALFGLNIKKQEEKKENKK